MGRPRNRGFVSSFPPLRTRPNEGAHEAGRRQGAAESLYAVISGTWDVVPLGPRPASTGTGIGVHRPGFHESESFTTVAMEILGSQCGGWNLGDDQLRRAATFHAQILGDSDQPPFPELDSRTRGCRASSCLTNECRRVRPWGVVPGQYGRERPQEAPTTRFVGEVFSSGDCNVSSRGIGGKSRTAAFVSLDDPQVRESRARRCSPEGAPEFHTGGHEGTSKARTLAPSRGRRRDRSEFRGHHGKAEDTAGGQFGCSRRSWPGPRGRRPASDS